MYSHSHFITGLAIGEMLVSAGLLSHGQALLAGILAVSIDLDHLVHHALLYGKWSPRDAWNGATVGKDFNYRTWFHRWQGWILVSALTTGVYVISISLAITVFVAYASHLLLDAYDFFPVSKRPFTTFRLVGLEFRPTLLETGFDGLMIIMLTFAVIL